MNAIDESTIKRLNSRSFKGIIFDFDGTLLDIKNAMVKAIEEIFAENKIDFEPEASLQEIGALLETLQGYPLPKIVLNSYEIFKYITTFKDITYIKKILISTKIFAKYLEYARQAPLVPGARELLEILKNKLGCDLFIISHNKKENLLFHLDKYGILNYFKGVFGTDDLPALKPDPQSLEPAIKEYPISVKRSEFVMIGDMPTDIQAGREAGFQTIALASGISNRNVLLNSRPNLIVNTLTELIDLINASK
ncbi:MAG: HAD family hydrolase [Candidatus Lokiarchaeota archaeon]|nr:HAD family hydrolase [Candidatus Lokiarchaeota archaeon]